MSEARRVGTPDWLTLSPGETVLVRAGPSQNLLLAGIGAGMVLLVVVSVVVASLGDIGIGRALSFVVVVLVVVALALIYALVHRWEYAVTSERACVTTGLLSRAQRSVPLDEVSDVRVAQTRWQRLVSVGDLVFVADDRTLRFAAVGAPHRVQERVLAAMDPS